MSIIHSALKKAEAEKTQSTHPGARAQDPVMSLSIDDMVSLSDRRDIQPHALSTNQLIVSVILGFSIFAIAVFWVILSKVSSRHAETAAVQPAAVSVQPQRQELPLRAPSKEAKEVPAAPLQPAAAQPAPEAASVPAPAAVVPPAKTPAPAGFNLTGIFISGESRIAVINGSLYQVGEEVHGARILQIEDRTVVLANGGQQFSLELPS